MITTMNMDIKKKTCKVCGYKWKLRTLKPKECPKCKRRLDK